MDKNEYVENKLLKVILDDFINSYIERDNSMKFSGWLGNKLRQEIPGMEKEASEKLAGEIIGAVAAYDRTLNELNQAIDRGQSKEGWFSDYLSKTYADMPPADAGQKLQQIEEGIAASNIKLMQEIGELQTEAEVADEVGDSTGWNEYNVKSKAREIGGQVVLTGIAVAANVMKEKIQDINDTDIVGVVKETLQGGLIKDSGEVKSVVAGAVKAATERGVKNIIPEDISEDAATDMIGNIAGLAVESVEAMSEMARGKSNTTEMSDKVGRATVAAVGRMASNVLKGCLTKVPIVGPVLVDLAGGLLDHLHSPKFVRNAYNTVRDLAKDTWEGVKNSRTFAILKKIGKVVLG